MVCKTCEKKLGKVSAADPFRNRNTQGAVVSSGLGSAGPSRGGPSASSTSSSSVRDVGKNKLLGAKNWYSPMAARCTLCKANVQQDKAKYCQQCAFKKGLCAMCGKAVVDEKVRKMSKMSSA
ncbi:hypothetical protein FA10DRAFT_288582 [Acaromyces ingoldii]|uniref:Cysteine-rich PDZ-binding protein n=1 Tax=Acaromyces ingoldii TaxID=215250 RepID=A0A316YEN0_9BASI|nr:hypothetical protein FA10DRAFT_288582 [Acaromyces ingoldii]PWN87877.1 hypothetical protein FA10DRAFT_288582 [Acaromyces ingoldii]